MNQTSTEILFDKFEIISCLKKDGLTGVYLANHIYLGKKIILKTLNTEGLSDKSILERFKREAKILAQLDHPNLIKVLDFGTYNNFFYISFEYFESKNLREVISSNHLSSEEKKYLIVQLLKALCAAHQNQIIHRDIKPENILVNSNLELKIADFGLALIINENTVTNSATIVGTPSYMAPEQIRGEKTQQTDLFSTGLVSYELFLGVNPVVGSDVGETINNILTFNLEKYISEIETLPPDIQTAIKCMLKSDLNNRAKTAGEVLKCLGESEEESFRIKLKSSKWNYRNVALFSSLAVVLTVAIIVALGQRLQNFQQKENQINNTAMQNPVVNKTGNNNSTTSSVDDKKNNPGANNKKEAKASDDKTPTPANDKKQNLLIPGTLSVDCQPWANVFIDGKKIDSTPLRNIILNPGEHIVKLIHPDYPSYTEKINIVSGNNEAINVNLDSLVGFLNCEIYPWGEIYIGGKYMGTTPMKPIILSVGEYSLVVKNANYSPVSKEIKILAKQTLNYKLNFEDLHK